MASAMLCQTLSLDIPSMDPDGNCQRKAAANGAGFDYSVLLLPAERRQAIITLYTFCREADDMVDGYNDLHVTRLKLLGWHARPDRVTDS